MAGRGRSEEENYETEEITSTQKILDLTKIKDKVETQQTMKHPIAPLTPSHCRNKKTGMFFTQCIIT